jgi:hypothetical protein
MCVWIYIIHVHIYHPTHHPGSAQIITPDVMLSVFPLHYTMFVYMRKCLYLYVCIYMYVYIHICIYVYIYIYIYVYIYIYIHVHT